MSDSTYYQRNRDVILNKTKVTMKTTKKNLKSTQEINIETFLKNKKVKRKNMEKTDIVICLKKKHKNEKNIKKTIARRKSLSIIV